MGKLKLPVGIENFEEIRTKGFYYVDKTELIRDLLNSWGKVNLFTRPRRFGKTLEYEYAEVLLRDRHRQRAVRRTRHQPREGTLRQAYGKVSGGISVAQGR